MTLHNSSAHHVLSSLMRESLVDKHVIARTEGQAPSAQGLAPGCGDFRKFMLAQAINCVD